MTCIRILFCNKNFRFVLQSHFREAFYKENMLKAIVQRLVTDNEELQGYCANAIFKVKQHFKSINLNLPSNWLSLKLRHSLRHP